MTFKIFRRGSARCIGLLSAFITILLCLYYISMGQPSIQPNKDPLQASLLTGQQQQQQATLISSASGISSSVHQQYYNKNYASHKMKFNSNNNNNNNDNEDNTASATYRQQQQQHKLLAKTALYSNDPALQAGTGTGSVLTTGNDGGLAGDGSTSGNGGSGGSSSSSTTYASSMYVNNPQWGDKCYILDESATNITAQEEYAKFDFQVNATKKNLKKKTQCENNILHVKNYI